MGSCLAHSGGACGDESQVEASGLPLQIDDHAFSALGLRTGRPGYGALA